MLLPDALRGDFDGETGGGILIESNMAASAAFSGDIGLASALTLRCGDCRDELSMCLASLSAVTMSLELVSCFGKTCSSEEPMFGTICASAGAAWTRDSFGLSGRGTKAASSSMFGFISSTCSLSSIIAASIGSKSREARRCWCWCWW